MHGASESHTLPEQQSRCHFTVLRNYLAFYNNCTLETLSLEFIVVHHSKSGEYSQKWYGYTIIYSADPQSFDYI